MRLEAPIYTSTNSAGRPIDRETPWPREGFVYFIQAMEEGGRGPVKVGWSARPYERLKALQADNPRALVLRRLFPGTMRMEHELHIALRPYRVRGEWFSWSPALERMMRRPSIHGQPPLSEGEAYEEVVHNEQLARRSSFEQNSLPLPVHHRIAVVKTPAA